jgi:hypothetical protein
VPIRGRSPLGRAGTHRSAVDNDPAFAIRVLADIVIRALSPAVNDPTTAVQSIDRIEDLLRYAAAKHLADGRVRDHRGTARLVYPTPAWDDLVALALDEIRAFGAGQYQIARRVWALLDGLLDGVPARRRPALLAQRALLDDAVVRRFHEDRRADALVADRQGLGMSRRVGATGSDRRSAAREISSGGGTPGARQSLSVVRGRGKRRETMASAPSHGGATGEHGAPQQGPPPGVEKSHPDQPSSRAARRGSLRTLNGNHADSPSASPRQDESGRGYWAVSPSRLGFTHPGGCRAVGVGIEWM